MAYIAFKNVKHFIFFVLNTKEAKAAFYSEFI